MDQHDPRAAHAADQIGGQNLVASGNPDGTGGTFDTLAVAWLPSRSRDSATEPDSGLAFLVLLAACHEDRDHIGAPYVVAVQRRRDGLHSWERTPWADLSAVEEVPTLPGALATFAARLTGIAVEALAEGHGL